MPFLALLPTFAQAVEVNTDVHCFFDETSKLRVEFRHIWLEVVDGTIKGKYQISSQGASIHGFTYTKLKTGAEFAFIEKTVANREGQCRW
ncbi:hypothetical protein [Alloalcanivorax xenomutans]|uniref:hypothetical protein n=1 Tax=Alloalcanivorax xenomutans TaxID=1094342 RepID=UPI0024E26843|nr:hypothetical protein [Alloalcanivorax xenomutans]